MKDNIINTTDKDVDIYELDSIVKFACNHLKVENPLLNIIIGKFEYGEFGLPFIHVIYYAISSIYSVI